MKGSESSEKKVGKLLEKKSGKTGLGKRKNGVHQLRAQMKGFAMKKGI